MNVHHSIDLLPAIGAPQEVVVLHTQKHGISSIHNPKIAEQHTTSQNKQASMVYEAIEDSLHVLDRINAMRSQEENNARCRGYSASLVDAPFRTAMADWCFVVADSFDLSRETVWIAMSILDRYLGSTKGEVEALRNKKTFQLASIASFHIAIKISEPVHLGIDLLIKLCRGEYNKYDVFSMEQDILFSLEWRVCISTTTPMDYVRQFLELLPEWRDASHIILENAMKYMERATRDIYFYSCKASSLGAACLSAGLDDTHVLSSFEKNFIWRHLKRKLDFLESDETRKLESRLVATSEHRKPKRRSRAGLRSSSVNLATEELSSPVSVMQASCCLWPVYTITST